MSADVEDEDDGRTYHVVCHDCEFERVGEGFGPIYDAGREHERENPSHTVDGRPVS